MSDQNKVSGQRNQGYSVPQRFDSDLEIVISLCHKYSEEYNQSYSSSISAEIGFFLKFLVKNSGYDEKTFRYWANIPIFDQINPVWDVKISHEAFNYFISEESKHDSMNYLIYLLQGRFEVTNKFDYFYSIEPFKSKNKKLFASMRKITDTEPQLKILVGLLGNEEIERAFLTTLMGIYENPEKIDDLKFEKNIILYKPEDFCIGETELMQEPKIVLQYLDPTRPFVPLLEFNRVLPLELEKLRDNIESNKKRCLESMNFYGDKNINWTKIVLKYFEKQQLGENSFNIFSNFNLTWKIVIEKDFLNILKMIEEQELLHYLSKFLKLSTGEILEDLETFESFNNKDNENFLIAPIVIKDTNLKPIISVLCVGKSFLNNDTEYQLKILGFYDKNNDLENQVKEFRDTEKYLRIEKTFNRIGMKSIVFIDEYRKIQPIFSINQLEENSSYRGILFLYPLPKDSSLYNFFLISASGGLFFCSKQLLKTQLDNKKFFILRVETNLHVNSSYTLRLKIKEINRSTEYNDESVRKIKNIDEDFLFGINFASGQKSFNRNFNIDDYYNELFLYVIYCIQSEKKFKYLIHSFSTLSFRNEDLMETSFEKQGMILGLVNSYYLDQNCETNLKQFYTILSILGLISKFPSEEINKKLSNWKKLVSNIENTIKEFINGFKTKANYNVAVKGIGKIYALARINEMNIDMLYNKINDESTSGDFILSYLENLKNNKILITSKELKDILDHLESFQNVKKIGISSKILELLLGLEQIIELLLHPVLKTKPIEEKSKLFSHTLRNINLNIESLFNFLHYLEQNKIYDQRLFAKLDIIEFLNKHLLKKNILVSEFQVIEKILILVKNDQIFCDFKISEFLIILASAHSIKKCIDLLLLFPDYIPEIFEKCNKIKFSITEPLKFYSEMQTELKPFPEKIQETILFRIFDKLSDKDLKYQIQDIYKNKNELVKNSFKKVFILKLLNFSSRLKYEETVKFLLSLKNVSKKNENPVLNYLFEEAQSVFRISENELTERILKNRQADDFLLEFIKNYDRKLNLDAFQAIFSFVKKQVKKIMNETIKLKYFKMICEKDEDIFFEYVECVNDTDYIFQDILNKFKGLHDRFKLTTEILRQIGRFIYKFYHDFKQTLNIASKDYRNFILEMHNLKISAFIIPESLIWISDLLKFPLKSIIFVNYIHRDSKRCTDQYENYFLSVQNILSDFFNTLSTNKVHKLQLNEVFSIIECMDNTKNFETELQELSKYFPQFFNSDSNIKRKLLKVFRVVNSYKDYNPLINSLKLAKEVLLLPEEIYNDYLAASFTNYNKKFSISVLKMENEVLNQMKRKERNSLIVFFSQVINSIKLIDLIYSLEEEDISFWHEIFDESLHLNISLNLIQTFSVVWSFFNIIKDFKTNLKSYLKKILKLMSADKYSSITELIYECNFRFHALDDFNKSLSDQEQAKLNKIKMICNSSLLKIISKERFSAEITVADSNRMFISDPIFFYELNELRDRALLSKNIINQQKGNNEADLHLYDQFVTIIDTLSKFIIILDELKNSFYRESLKEEYRFYIEDGYFEELKIEFINHENCLNNVWKSAVKIFCKTSFLINFLSEKMIYLIDKFVFDRSEYNLERILKVLTYMNKIPPKLCNKKKNPPLDFSKRLSKIDKFLNSLKNIEKALQLSLKVALKIKIKNSILIVETNQFFKGVFSIYTNYQKTLPRADLVLFCHFLTNWVELKRFLKRCSLNQEKEIYTLIYPEKLSLENQTKVDSMLNRFTRKNKLYSLAIVTNDLKSKLLNNVLHNPYLIIEKVQNLMMLNDDQIKSLMRDLAPNMVVVTSAYVGLGKSEFIKEVARTKNLPLIDINISASYENSSLCKKIEKALSPNKAVYKLNLNFLSDPEYFHELIFSLTVFKVVYNEQSIIVFSKDSYVYIEVANTFNNILYNSVLFLKYLNTENINQFILEKVKQKKKLIYVCNYLGLLDNRTIQSRDLEYKVNSKASLFGDKNVNIQLLQKYFLPNCGNFPNYHQLNTFLKILSNLFMHFEKSMFTSSTIQLYRSDYMVQNVDIFSELRSSIITNLIETSKEFMSKCVDSVKRGQNSIINSQDGRNVLAIDEIIKWENSNHFIMIFQPDGDFMCIYRSPEIIPVFIRKFIISQSLIENIIRGYAPNNQELWTNCINGIGFIEDYRSYQSSVLIEKLVDFYKSFALRRSNESDHQNAENLIQKRIYEASISGYILTPDNFLKMNLIYLRCMSNLPLIIMGETGCGKTSLLRFFIEKILRESFLIIYIHSGITVLDIQNHLTKANNEASKLKNQRVWVFFDEFNTSDTMGEIVTILCERQFEGIKFHQNLAFVGACNPYRLKPVTKFNENIGIKKIREDNNKMQAVHMVKPLPDKAIEFVWDFGTLKHEEIKDYVHSMLQKVGLKKIDLFTNLICEAHKYFQVNEDYSSVSLREINRFILLYRWFSESIKNREKYKLKRPLREYTELLKSTNETNIFNEITPEILSFIHCYYLRISTFTQRQELLQIITNILNIKSDQLLNLIKLQELELLSRMTLLKGIALNEALMENIFATFPCVLNKIPIFICGKPGCSKSLAINILFSSLRGDRSFDEYFRTLPELQIVSFQGSDSCTSEGIEAVFEKAEKLINHNRNILPVVLFDEIGLAEISVNNPLKILHKLLEYENCKVGFIAISNWRLDASKMNRALYLARPDPEKLDLELTAETIFRSHFDISEINKYSNLFKDIAEGYYNFKQENSKTDFPDFYGLRDFYHTVKYIARNLSSNSIFDELTIIQSALYRNFNGLPDSNINLYKHFPKIFANQIILKDPVNLIIKNLKDCESRYLMIICAQDTSEYLKSYILSNYLRDYRFILGSTFEKDINQDSSRFRILSDIIGFMEQGIPVILQNMDIIYSSLYDLFNQHFTVLGKTRKYCRVALGAQFNPRCLVHDNFKAIVFVDSDKNILQSTGAPFLNRFEKHYIVLNDIFQDDLILASYKVCEWAESIIKISSQKNILSVTSVFPLFNQETIILFMTYLKKKLKIKSLIKKCKIFLIENASMDIIVLCKLNELSDKKKQNIIEKWKRVHSLPLVGYLENHYNKILSSGGKERLKMISVTYDSTDIDFIKQELGPSTQLEKCSNFKSEEEFKMNYERFLKEGNKVLYLIEFDYSKESKHLRLIVSLIELLDKNFEVKEKNLVKNICIIVRQKRSDQNKKALLLFKDWKYFMFEHLVFSSNEIIEELIGKDLITIIKEEKIFKFENFSVEIIEKSIDSLSLKSSLVNYQYLFDFKKELFDYITDKPQLLNAFKFKVIDQIEKMNIGEKEKWLKELFISEKVINSSVSINDAMKVFIYDKFLLEFTKLIVVCEKKSGLSSLLFTKTSTIMFNNWIEIFMRLETVYTQVQLKPESNEIKFVKQFNFPYFYDDYYKLKVKYTELVNTGLNEDEITYELRYTHLNKSIWKDKSILIYENKEIEKIFIEDFIKTTLIEKLSEINYIEYIYLFIYGLLELSPYHSKLKILFDSQIKIVSFKNLISLYSKYTTPSNLLSIISIFNSKLSFAEKLKSIFKKIIKEITQMNKKSVASINFETYPQDIFLLNDLILDLAIDIKLKVMNKLEFLVRLCSLKSEKLNIKIGMKLNGESHKYLFKKRIAKWVIKKISKVFPRDNQQTFSFKSFFFNQLIENNIDLVPVTIDQINKTECWKFSGVLIQTLLNLSLVPKILEDFEMNLTNFTNLLNKKNKYLEKICDKIKKLNLNEPFCVIFREKIKDLKFNIKPLVYGDVCKVYMDYIEKNANQKDKIGLIIAIGRLQYYLFEFSRLNSKVDLTEDENIIIKGISRVLGQRNLLVFELYCLKVLKGFIGDNTLLLNEYCNNTLYKWKIDYDNIKLEKSSNLFIIAEESIKSKEYLMIKKGIQKIRLKSCDNNFLNNIINKSQNENSTFTLGLAFMNTVYLEHATENFNNNLLIEWYRENELLIIQNYSFQFSIIIKLFINNFSRDSLCHLYNGIEQKKLNIALLISYCALITISYSKKPNIFSSQFFDLNGELYTDIFKESKMKYFIGAETRGIQDYLNSMKENFTFIKNNKPGSYVCSNDCDYFYIIQNCGQAAVEMNCPFCNRRIGGQNHVLVSRPGHRGLTDVEAIAYLNQKCDSYRASEPRGFKIFSTNIPKCLQRGLKSYQTFTLLNFFTNSVFYFLQSSEIYPNDQILKIYGNSVTNLDKTIKTILLEDYSEIVKDLKLENLGYYLLATANKFKELIAKFIGKSENKHDRDNFEVIYEQSIMVKSPFDLSNEYKQCLHSETEPSNLFNYIEESLLPNEQIYKFSELFRYSLEPSWDLLKQSLITMEKKEEFRGLNYYIKRYEKLQNLKFLLPIASFSTQMIKECSSQYSRAEAKLLTIGDFLSQKLHLNNYFNEFFEAWSNLKIKLKFDCKTFNKFEITRTTPIGYLLLDTDINSLGITLAAALKSLCKLQNKNCSLLSKNNKGIAKKHSITNLSKEDIFYISLETLENIAKKNSINSYEYGKGRNIYFNFQEILNDFENHLGKAKFLDDQNFELVQYQYELLYSKNKYAGIINELRDRIKQLPLDHSEVQIIENFVLKKSEDLGTEAIEVWSQAYAWLEKAIIFVRYSEVTHNDNIKNYSGIKLKNIQDFKLSEIFCQFKVGQFLMIYELVEMKIYPKIVKLIEQTYKMELDDIVVSKKEIMKFCDRIKLKFSVDILFECHKVLRRVILRLLTANIDCNFEIGDYFGIESYWNYKFLNVSENIAEWFPKGFTFSNAIEIDKLFEEVTLN